MDSSEAILASVSSSNYTGCHLQVPDEVDAAMREADLDGNGEISLDEFAHLLTVNSNDALDLFETRLKK